MALKKKRALTIANLVLAFIVIPVIAFFLLFDINSYKPRVETAVSEATGLDIRINGKMGLSFIPFGVSAKDIHISGKGAEFLSLEKLKIGVELIPLVKKQIKVTSCELVKPAITIVKGADGKYNFKNSEKESTETGPGTSFRLNDLKLSQGALIYLDEKTGENTKFTDFNLVIKDLLIADTSGDILKDISFSGNLDCKKVQRKNLTIDNVKSPVKVANGMVNLTSLTMDIFGSKAEGDFMADKSEIDAVYKINLKISKLDFAKLEESFGTKKAIGGKVDLYVSLTMKEKESHNLISNMDGTFSLQGDNLVIYTMDLDKVLSSYETSQEFNLVDLGAFFIAGPFSTVALKAYHYGDIYIQAQDGQGVIKQFVSDWNIKNGVADATDCALATHHHRLALKGKLNLVSEQYDKVTVALLDEKGCAKFKQSISGSFGSPQVGAMSVAESLIGPISDLYSKAKRLLQGGRCEAFYNGSVRQP